jgi:Flp pilus assembly protein TadD
MALTSTQQGPGDLAATLAAVESALWASDLPKAMRLSEEAIARGAAHPTLLGLAGLRRMHAGDNHGALPLLLRAREQTPRHVDLLNALGECYSRLERPREAVEVFDAALKVAPDARLHFGRALALEDLRELVAAPCFERVGAQSCSFRGLGVWRCAMQRGGAKPPATRRRAPWPRSAYAVARIAGHRCGRRTWPPPSCGFSPGAGCFSGAGEPRLCLESGRRHIGCAGSHS